MKIALALAFVPLAMAADTVQGTVVDASTGVPLAGAYALSFGPRQTVVRTDAAGRFQLEAGQYPFTVVRSGYVDVQHMWQLHGKETVVRMTPEAVISGKLEDEDGFPVVGAQVSAQRYTVSGGERKLDTLRLATSNDLGEYRIGGLPPGRYYIAIDAFSARNWDGRYLRQFLGGTVQPDEDRAVELKAGEHRERLDARLAKIEGVSISGRVDLPRGAVSNPGYVEMASKESGRFINQSVPLRADGSFVATHVPPGRYALRYHTGFGDPKAGDLRAEITVDVGASDVSAVEMRTHVVEPVDIAGKVAAPGGDAPGPMTIAARRSTGQGVTVHSDADGSFVLKGLLPGHYTVQVLPDLPGKQNYFPRSIKLGETDVRESGFDVDTQPAGPLTVTLVQPITVAGKALDALGQPLSERVVHFVSGNDQTGALTDAAGNFVAAFMSAGEYRVYLMPDQTAMDENYLKAHTDDFPVLRVVEGPNAAVVLQARR